MCQKLESFVEQGAINLIHAFARLPIFPGYKKSKFSFVLNKKTITKKVSFFIKQTKKKLSLAKKLEKCSLIID